MVAALSREGEDLEIICKEIERHSTVAINDLSPDIKEYENAFIEFENEMHSRLKNAVCSKSVYLNFAFKIWTSFLFWSIIVSNIVFIY